MKSCAKPPSFAPALPGQMPGTWYTTSIFNTAHASPWKHPSDPQPTAAPRKMAKPALIYVVDDEEGLTELYGLFLKGTGHVVRAFNRRALALAALSADRLAPDLLIMDCIGDEMPADRFMQCCLDVHPSLRILMTSGFSQSDVRFTRAKPDRFLRKPFTADEFLAEVEAALAEA